jgi:membrane protease YdiL (CAAX protease family)
MGVRVPGEGVGAGCTAHPSAKRGDQADIPSSVLSWPAWSAPVAAVVVVGLVLLTPAVVGAVAGVFGVRLNADELPAWAALVIFFLRESTELGVAVALAWGLTAKHRAASPRSAVWPADWVDATIGIMAVLMLVLAFGAALNTVFGLRSGGDYASFGQTWSVGFVLGVLITIAVGPVCEEILFRGYIFAALARWSSVWPAALITGVGFGAIHLLAYPPLQCVPLAVLGVGLCVLYRHTGSLVPCMIVHGLINAAGYAADAHLAAGQRVVLLAAAPIAVLAIVWVIAYSRTIRTLATSITTLTPSSDLHPSTPTSSSSQSGSVACRHNRAGAGRGAAPARGHNRSRPALEEESGARAGARAP